MDPRSIEQIGPYPVVEFLAEGGMAWVFKVEDPKFHVHRALKMLKPQAAQGEEFRRFETEAKLLASIDHPNLITIYDFGRDEPTDCYYYTMTFVDGPPLSTSEPMALERAVAIFLDVLAALERLHQRGIVHRDVKPGNILMMSDGRVLLGDLGIARQQDQMLSLTRTGMAIGSVQYMSPEQARGEMVSPASDVFSLGLTLYQVLTGHTIYHHVDEVDATSGEQVLMYLGVLLHSGRELPFRFPSGFPRELRQLIERACRFDPAQRYPDAGALREALRRVDLDARDDAPRWELPSPRVLAAGAAGLLVVGALAWGLLGGSEEPTAVAETPAAPAVVQPVEPEEQPAAPPPREVAPPPEPVVAVTTPSLLQADLSEPPLPQRYAEQIERLVDRGVAIEDKRALVAGLASDASAEATAVLIAASDIASVRIAVDAVKLLNERVDDEVGAHLIALLDDGRFPVRAWAARGLGEARHAPAGEALAARLEVEQHAAVQREIRRAIGSLPEAAAGE